MNINPPFTLPIESNLSTIAPAINVNIIPLAKEIISLSAEKLPRFAGDTYELAHPYLIEQIAADAMCANIREETIRTFFRSDSIGKNKKPYTKKYNNLLKTSIIITVRLVFTILFATVIDKSWNIDDKVMHDDTIPIIESLNPTYANNFAIKASPISISIK